ncbi:hypothetical protein LJC22_04395 [Desulfosarcina sp. OttesenSCG-928-G10]|nr:hypothetical protein [Desulfosarcina sp. OttesenSCG-928-G10]
MTTEPEYGAAPGFIIIEIVEMQISIQHSCNINDDLFARCLFSTVTRGGTTRDSRGGIGPCRIQASFSGQAGTWGKAG